MTSPTAPAAPRDALPSAIVLAEADGVSRRALAGALQAEGFVATEVADGLAALEEVKRGLPRLTVLARELPLKTGVEVCRELRSEAAYAAVRLLMLSGSPAEQDCLEAYEAGVDDYVLKPCHPREVVLRVLAILRRSQQVPEGPSTQTVHGAITLDLERHTVEVSGQPVDLTATEFRMLVALVRAGGKVRSRQALMEELRGTQGRIELRSVDTQVRRLRDKLGAAGEQIQTVRSFGYRFMERI